MDGVRSFLRGGMFTKAQEDLIVEFGVRFARTMTPDEHEAFCATVLPLLADEINAVPDADLRKQQLISILRRVGEALTGETEPSLETQLEASFALGANIPTDNPPPPWAEQKTLVFDRIAGTNFSKAKVVSR